MATTFRRDPRKAERLAAIEAALAENAPYTGVFHADEANVDLDPRIGSSWVRCGEQTTVPTPGRIQKHYLAGALQQVRTGCLVRTEHRRKTSVPFVQLLEQRRRQYRRARRIVLIADNYGIRKSRERQRSDGRAPEGRASVPAHLPSVGERHRAALEGHA